MIVVLGATPTSRPATTQPASRPVSTRPASRPATAGAKSLVPIEEAKAAIKEGRVIEGMTIGQARMAMKGGRETVRRDKLTVAYSWSFFAIVEEKVERPPGYGKAYRQNPGRFAMIDSIKTRKLVRQVTAETERGLVVGVSETTGEKPPK